MLLHEWSLVLFTLLAQTAAGIVLAGECMFRCTEDARIRRRIRGQSVAALVLLALAALLSLTHLGSPLNAFNTILNIGNSWLSREIVMVGVFGVALLWLVLKHVKNQGGESPAALAAAVAGILLVAVMSQVYRTPLVPAWTPLGLPAFFGSALTLGAAWNALFLCKDISNREASNPGAPLPLLAVAGLILIAVSLPYAAPVSDAAVNANTALIPAACLVDFAVWHAALSGIGVLLVGAVALRRPFGSALPASGLALLLLLAGEFLGRVAFYLSYARLGI